MSSSQTIQQLPSATLNGTELAKVDINIGNKAFMLLGFVIPGGFGFLKIPVASFQQVMKMVRGETLTEGDKAIISAAQPGFYFEYTPGKKSENGDVAASPLTFTTGLDWDMLTKTLTGKIGVEFNLPASAVLDKYTGMQKLRDALKMGERKSTLHGFELGAAVNLNDGKWSFGADFYQTLSGGYREGEETAKSKKREDIDRRARLNVFPGIRSNLPHNILPSDYAFNGLSSLREIFIAGGVGGGANIRENALKEVVMNSINGVRQTLPVTNQDAFLALSFNTRFFMPTAFPLWPGAFFAFGGLLGADVKFTADGTDAVVLTSAGPVGTFSYKTSVSEIVNLFEYFGLKRLVDSVEPLLGNDGSPLNKALSAISDGFASGKQPLQIVNDAFIQAWEAFNQERERQENLRLLSPEGLADYFIEYLLRTRADIPWSVFDLLPHYRMADKRDGASQLLEAVSQAYTAADPYGRILALKLASYVAMYGVTGGRKLDDFLPLGVDTMVTGPLGTLPLTAFGLVDDLQSIKSFDDIVRIVKGRLREGAVKFEAPYDLEALNAVVIAMATLKGSNFTTQALDLTSLPGSAVPGSRFHYRLPTESEPDRLWPAERSKNYRANKDKANQFLNGHGAAAASAQVGSFGDEMRRLGFSEQGHASWVNATVRRDQKIDYWLRELPSVEYEVMSHQQFIEAELKKIRAIWRAAAFVTPTTWCVTTEELPRRGRIRSRVFQG